MNKNNKKKIPESILWGVELSPFVLKMQAYLDYLDIPYRRLPHQGSYIENAQVLLKLEYQKQHKLIKRFPEMDEELDEYPSVPFYSENGKDFQYDSSSIAMYLDSKGNRKANACDNDTRLFPTEPSLNFVASLIDEAFDEFGLYLVHHMRWVGSAKTNIMGKLLAKEFRHALPPGGPLLLSKSFPRRQVKRCPYLFSVAPKTYRSGLSRSLTPPHKAGFPETHTLLFESWKQYLKGMEEVLTKQRFLLGDRFTIADASAYGQLAMNLVDPEAKKIMQEYAPYTHSWLEMIYQGRHRESDPNGALYLSSALDQLLNTLMSTYASLMVQNSKAYKLAKAKGENEFNELAFNKGKSLYTGTLRGYPFKTVVKTFQVRTWRELCAKWEALPPEAQSSVNKHLELSALFCAH